jgi:hypothetical protein
MGTVERVVGSDMVLLWLDEHICQDDTCTELKNEFESSTATNIYLYHDVDRCRRFIRKLRNKKAFCIIQGRHAKDVVPDIIQYTNSPVVYIFCLEMLKYTEWAQDFQCILEGGVFGHEKDLLAKLTVDLSDYANQKAQEYRVKRTACDEWAKNLTNTAKRLKNDQYTLTFPTDPFSDQDTPGVEPRDVERRE